MPYHWYTDQRFALFIMCLIIILPLSIPKEIGIQKYTRYATLICSQIDIQLLCDLTVFSSYQCVGDTGRYISVCGSYRQILPDGEPRCYHISRAQPRVSNTVFNGYMCVFIFCLSLCTAAVMLASVNVCVFYSISSWASMFSVVPTICFGFQVGSTSGWY